MRRDSRLTTIIEALQTGPGGNRRAAHRIWGRAAGSAMDQGADGNVWSADIHDLALHIHTRLYGRPDSTTPVSPLAQAEDFKRLRDLGGELGALMSAGAALESAPWYPVRSGDLVHVHYEAVDTQPAFGETYVIGDVGSGLQSMQLTSHTYREDNADVMVGLCAVDAADDPVCDLWFEAGPQRLTIVRDGRVVHDGGAAHPRPGGGALLKAFGLMVVEATRYLERGDAGAALARLRSEVSLPPCGSTWPTTTPCARPKGHSGMCSDNADYTDPPHECPALPEQLHAVVTVGATATGVHFAGLHEDQEAAADHAMGFHAFRYELDALTERFVKPAPGLPGEMALTLPKAKELQATGVQLAVVVPLRVLPDPRAEDEWAAEGMATALGPDDYADDFRDVDE